MVPNLLWKNKPSDHRVREVCLSHSKLCQLQHYQQLNTSQLHRPNHIYCRHIISHLKQDTERLRCKLKNKNVSVRCHVSRVSAVGQVQTYRECLDVFKSGQAWNGGKKTEMSREKRWMRSGCSWCPLSLYSSGWSSEPQIHWEGRESPSNDMLMWLSGKNTGEIGNCANSPL